MIRQINLRVFVLLVVITLAFFSGCTTGGSDEELELGPENEKFTEQITNQPTQTIPASGAVFGVASDVNSTTPPLTNQTTSAPDDRRFVGAVFGVRSAITTTTPPPTNTSAPVTISPPPSPP